MTSFVADLVVVLGARVYPDGRPGPALQRRVERGARALRDGVAPVIVCTGGKRWNGHSEALRMREELLRLGIDDAQVLLEPFALSTAENALFSSRLMRLHGWRRAAVVTCPWHMERALHDFRRCGVQAEPMPTEPGQAGPMRSWWRGTSERVSRVLDGAMIRARAGA